MQTDFTARLEQQLDSISAGEGEPTDFLSSWWSEFNEAVTAVETADTLALREAVADKCAWTLFPSDVPIKPPPLVTGTTIPQQTNGEAAPVNGAAATPRADRVCPSCGTGQMTLKFSRFGPFVGCTEYPACGWTMKPREPWSTMDANDAAVPIDKLSLGVLAKGALPPSASGIEYTGLEVSVRDGPVGWYVQLGGNVTHELQQLKPPPDIKALKVVQLREELERGLDITGRKAELVERLTNAEI